MFPPRSSQPQGDADPSFTCFAEPARNHKPRDPGICCFPIFSSSSLHRSLYAAVSHCPSKASTMSASFSTADVSKHNKGTDLYIIVDEDVYDLTKFQDEHPGGKKSESRKHQDHPKLHQLITPPSPPASSRQGRLQAILEVPQRVHPQEVQEAAASRIPRFQAQRSRATHTSRHSTTHSSQAKQQCRQSCALSRERRCRSNAWPSRRGRGGGGARPVR